MDKQPTEARQDELAGIREKIAQIDYIRTHKAGLDLLSGFQGEVLWEQAPLEVRANCFEYADQILSLPVSSGGVCPECKGSKKLQPYFDHCFSNRCPACNGTGQKQPKTLGEIIKEGEDGTKEMPEV